MFAVIKTGGKQYRVAAEDILQIERISGEVGDIVQIGDVLAHGAGDDVTFGAPFIDGASVAAEVIEQGRAKTVIAFKKRRRQNSRRKQGHRQLLTTVRISEILTGGAKPSKKAKGKPAAAKDVAPKTDKAKAEAPVETPVEAGTEAPAAGKAKAAKGDDLTAIKGIGPKAAEQLAEQGVTSYADLAGLDDERIAEIDEAMPFSADQINDWREQAKELTK